MKKNARGLYQKQVTIVVDGKKKQKAFYGKTISEVNRKMLLFKETNKIAVTYGETLSVWVDRWFEYHQTHIKRNTIESYIRPILDVKEYFKDEYISEIKPSHIKEFLFYLEKMKYAKQTINLRRVVLCKTFDFAIEQDVNIVNVARNVRLPTGLKVSKRNLLSKEDICLIKGSENLYANFLLYTGCRKNEAFAIMWEDIDFASKLIKIDKAFVYNGNNVEVSAPKSLSSIRTIPLLSPLETMLLKYKKNHGYVFQKENLPLTKKQARLMWEEFTKKIGKHITPHQFRHAFITLMYEAGVDAKSAQYIAGHSKIEITLDIYTHLSENDNNIARDKLNTLLSY